MEAAISSTLSHPNVVSTYTYAIKPCEDLALKKTVEAHAIVMQGLDSLDASAPPPANPIPQVEASGEPTDAQTNQASSSESETKGRGKGDVKPKRRASSSEMPPSAYIHSYEVKLVIEFCDRGTLRQGASYLALWHVFNFLLLTPLSCSARLKFLFRGESQLRCHSRHCQRYRLSHGSHPLCSNPPR